MSRRFSDGEAAEVLRRAAELQARSRHEPDGIALEELQRVATEAGIAPEFVSIAAGELLPKGHVRQERWLGAPQSFELVEYVDGVLTPVRWASIVATMNDEYGQTVAGSFENGVGSWGFKHSLGQVEALATPKGRGFEVRLRHHIDDGVTMVWLITLIPLLLLSVACWTSLPPLAALAANFFACGLLILAVWSACRSWYQEDRAKRGSMLAGLSYHGHELVMAQAPMIQDERLIELA